jgi:hypothetical protein
MDVKIEVRWLLVMCKRVEGVRKWPTVLQSMGGLGTKGIGLRISGLFQRVIISAIRIVSRDSLGMPWSRQYYYLFIYSRLTSVSHNGYVDTIKT